MALKKSEKPPRPPKYHRHPCAQFDRLAPGEPLLPVEPPGAAGLLVTVMESLVIATVSDRENLVSFVDLEFILRRFVSVSIRMVFHG